VSDSYDDSRWSRDTELEDADAGLDEARENVLEDWPAPLLAPSDDESGEPSLPFDAEPFSAEPDADPPAPAPIERSGEIVSEVEPFAAHVTAPDEEVAVEVPVEQPEEHVVAPEPVAEQSAEHAPGELVVPPGYAVLEGVPEGRRRTVAVVVSRFNGDVTNRLLRSALDELERAGVTSDSITVMPVPGAFELPLAAMALAKTRRFAAVVALGCVIRGDTPHFDYVASEAASGLQLAALETGVPVAFGLLTLDREEQAEHRIAKAAEAVRTALEMADVFAHLRAAAAAP
jgi:6,7-dimethyl-8-ribityllumazine synthase